MRTLVWLGSTITLLGAAAMPACGSGDVTGSAGGGDCNAVCAAMQRAQCASPSQQDCLQDCQAYVTSAPATCRAEFNAAMSCSSSATYTCDSDGVATTSTCNSQQAALTACRSTPSGGGGTGGNGDPGPAGGTRATGGTGATVATGGTGATGGATCSSVCPRVLVAACPNDTLSSCVTSCQTLQSESTGCLAQFDAFLGCLTTATFTCTTTGTFTTNSCPTQTTALDACLSGAPAGWTCTASWYSDDECDCGCSVADPDCAGAGCIAPGCNDTSLYSACITSN